MQRSYYHRLGQCVLTWSILSFKEVALFKDKATTANNKRGDLIMSFFSGDAYHHRHSFISTAAQKPKARSVACLTPSLFGKGRDVKKSVSCVTKMTQD